MTEASRLPVGVLEAGLRLANDMEMYGHKITDFSKQDLIALVGIVSARELPANRAVRERLNGLREQEQERGMPQ